MIEILGVLEKDNFLVLLLVNCGGTVLVRFPSNFRPEVHRFTIPNHSTYEHAAQRRSEETFYSVPKWLVKRFFKVGL